MHFTCVGCMSHLCVCVQYVGEEGIPKLREPWLRDHQEGTQMTAAKRGEITPEMKFAAQREVRHKLPTCSWAKEILLASSKLRLLFLFPPLSLMSFRRHRGVAHALQPTTRGACFTNEAVKQAEKDPSTGSR